MAPFRMAGGPTAPMFRPLHESGFTPFAMSPAAAPVAPPAPAFNPDPNTVAGTPAGPAPIPQAAPAASPATGSSPTAGGGAAPGGGFASFNANSISFSADPILAKVRALATRQVADAQAESLAAQKVNLIRYGDPELAQKILGARGGGAAAAAAGANPFSTVKELSRWNTRQGVNIDETRNQQNLYYSTTRARDHALQGEDYLRQQSKTGSQLQDTLTQIAMGLLSAKRTTEMEIQDAESAAYDRALQRAESAQYYGAGPTGAVAPLPDFLSAPPQDTAPQETAPAAPAWTNPVVRNVFNPAFNPRTPSTWVKGPGGHGV